MFRATSGLRSIRWAAARAARPARISATPESKPGVTFAQAEADVKRVATEIAALDPASHPSYTARLDDLRESVLLTIKPTLLVLIAAAALLLLITCADVAGLLLARSVARARETAIRVALGAAGRQLAVHYFMEGLIVSLAGAAAGVLVSAVLVRIVVALAAEYIPRADEIALDWTVLLFAGGCALVASAPRQPGAALAGGSDRSCRCAERRRPRDRERLAAAACRSRSSSPKSRSRSRCSRRAPSSSRISFDLTRVSPGFDRRRTC